MIMKAVKIKTEMAHLKGLHDHLKEKLNDSELELTKSKYLIKGLQKYIKELEDKYLNINVKEGETNVT